jgi:ribosomal protein S13
MVVSDLVNKISFVGSLTPLDKLNTGLTTSIKSIGLSTVAFGTAGIALNAWVKSATDGIYSLANLSKDVGVSVEAMQEWGFVASLNGSTAEAVNSSILGLSERIGEYANLDSGEGKAIFEKLGISIKDATGNVKTADVVMNDLRKSMQGMGASEQISILNKLGIDKSMIQTLRLTDEQMASLTNRAKALGVVTTEQGQAVIDYQDSLTALGYGLNAVKTQLAIALTPSLKDAANAFTDLLADNKDLVQNGLSKTIGVLSSFVSALFNAGELLYNVIDNTIGFKNAMMLLGAAILYVNRAMYLNPLGALIGSIILAIGVVDDLMVAFDGGESVIKDFFASFDVDIVKTLTSAFDVLKGTWNGLIAIALRLSESVLSLFAILEKGGKFAGVDFGLGLEEQYAKTKLLREEYQKLSKEQLGGAFKEGINITPTLNQNAILPNSMTTNSNTSVSNNQSNVFNFDIKNDNPTATYQTIRDNLNKELANANKQFNNGGL